MSSGLNGFFKNFWNGFKSVFTSTTTDDQPKTFGGWLGRILAKASLLLAAKESEYIPTSNELIVLNPIKDSLNNWLIQKGNEIDSEFTNSTANSLNLINKTIRQLQLIGDYYSTNPLNISVAAHQYLVSEIDLMTSSLLLTIENLMNANSIVYEKIEGILEKVSDDQFPVQFPINFEGFGVQYLFENSDAIINTEIPINENLVEVVPTQVTSTSPINVNTPATTNQGTTPTNTATPTKSSPLKRLAVVGGVITAIWLIFSKEE